MSNDPKQGAPSDEGFLARWSRRKREGGADEIRDDEAAPATPSPTDAASPEAEPEHVSEEPAVTEADLENLSYDSDYTKFMGEGVPEAIRRQALRQLWRSDPVLANVDGLVDYGEDFTDAATVVENLQTAYRVGKGFFSDEELEADADVSDAEVNEGDVEADIGAGEGEPNVQASTEPGDPAPAAEKRET